jgi:hypothetical protein
MVEGFLDRLAHDDEVTRKLAEELTCTKTAINPECKAGKHPNCDGGAMCNHILCDDIHLCECDCHQGWNSPPEDRQPLDTQSTT